MIKYDLHKLSREQKRSMRQRPLKVHDLVTFKEFNGLLSGDIKKIRLQDRY